jgi:hypothetical protein
MAVREDLLAAGLAVFDMTASRGDGGGHSHPRAGLERQLLPFLRIEEGTGGHAVSGCCGTITPRCWLRSTPPCSAQEGIGRLIRAHLDWVANNRREARYLFEISRGEWTEKRSGTRQTQNSRLAEGVERWRAPLIARGELLPMTSTLFFSQIVGPAQIFCRAWLSGRDRSDPRLQADILIACAIRALVAPEVIQQTGGTS